MSRMYEAKELASLAAPFKVYIYKNSVWMYIYLIGTNSKGNHVNIHRSMLVQTDTGLRKLLGVMIDELKKEAEEK